MIPANNGAASTESSVVTSSNVVTMVSSLRTNASPPSASSRSARVSTGMKIAVKVASSTSAAMMLGSVLAVEKALADAAPSAAVISSSLTKPVMRLTKVATAIDPEWETTAASDSSSMVSSASGSGSGSSGSLIAATGPPSPVRRARPRGRGRRGPADHGTDATAAGRSGRRAPWQH
ncbi:Uncharacterised protein [Mycobacteroides abscessus subsp. massiliense]|nr:Uncharacterised protein [Mycobacteroides abscessus subsp. massiliense]